MDDLEFKGIIKLSDVDDVYGESGVEEIRYKPPVEFNAYVKIDAPNNKSYGSGLVNQMEPGNMTLGVYNKHLEELSIDINYGDYIGYPENETTMRYYVVANDGRVTSDIKHTIGGYKAFYRTIVCSWVSENEFKGV